MNRYLIVNADDFGFCAQTNRAIAELFAANKITSTNLLMSAEGTDEAVQLIKRHSYNFGVHLTLNSDFEQYPWAALYKGGSLADQNGKLYFDTAYIAKHAKSKDVTRECTAQIEACLSCGITPDHLDNHCGTMYGINMRLFFINAFRLSKSYNLPFRFPQRGGFLRGYFMGKVPAYVRAAHKAVVMCARVMGASVIDDMITNPYPIKDIPDYKALEEYYLSQISGISEGVTELFMHPSYDAPQYSAITPEWKKRLYELDFLFSPALEKRLSDEGIQLISYKDICNIV